jgi:hypothetical protein
MITVPRKMIRALSISGADYNQEFKGENAASRSAFF